MGKFLHFHYKGMLAAPIPLEELLTSEFVNFLPKIFNIFSSINFIYIIFSPRSFSIISPRSFGL